MSVKGLESLEVMLGTISFEMAMTLTAGHLDDLQFAVEGVYLHHNVEHPGVGLVVPSELGNQPPIIHAMCQVHSLVVRGRFSQDGVDEPYGEWLSRGVADV